MKVFVVYSELYQRSHIEFNMTTSNIEGVVASREGAVEFREKVIQHMLDCRDEDIVDFEVKRQDGLESDQLVKVFIGKDHIWDFRILAEDVLE